MKNIEEIYENYKVLVKNELRKQFPLIDEVTLEALVTKITLLCATKVVDEILRNFKCFMFDSSKEE